jgi:Na+/H+ antiporter NhaC
LAKHAKHAKDSRLAQVLTAIMGVFVFFDDYANTLIVGPTMRPITDKLKVSREKLAYIVDSTAAPVVGLAFISTWVGTEIGYIRDFIPADVSALEMFLRSIPYSFYNIFAIFIVFTIGFTGRDFGPMLHAERRALKENKPYADGADLLSGDLDKTAMPKEGAPIRIINAILPIGTLILVTFFGIYISGAMGLDGEGKFALNRIGEAFGNADPSIPLIWAAFISTIVAIILAVSQRILKLGEAMDTFINGSKGLMITAMILILAWSLGSVIGELGADSYLASIVEGIQLQAFFPLIVFVTSMLIAFATGTSWGTMGIVFPLALPIAVQLFAFQLSTGDITSSSIVLATISSILSGLIFGDHCSPISDTTIMSSMASGSDHLDHVKTQIPYALTGAAFAALSYLLVGITGITPFIPLALGVIGIVFFVLKVGKKVSD